MKHFFVVIVTVVKIKQLFVVIVRVVKTKQFLVFTFLRWLKEAVFGGYGYDG